MKKLIYILFIFLSFVSCSINTNKTNELYTEYDKQISEYYNQFYIDSVDDNPSISKFTSENPSQIKSTEGSLIIKYTNKKDLDNILKYTINVFGEHGQVTYNYFYIDSFIYYQILHINYTSYNLNNSSEHLYYEIQDFIIDTNNYYIMDKINRDLIPIEFEKLPNYYSLIELEKIFNI